MVEFHVLRCADCQTFQVMQVTKSVKWKCKMCGQKQSVTKVYGQGSGADCRRHVQKLNGLHFQTKWTNEEQQLVSATQVSASTCFPCPENILSSQGANSTTGQVSRWSNFVDVAKDEEDGSLKTKYKNIAESETTSHWNEYQESFKRGKRKRDPTTEFPVINSPKFGRNVYESPSLSKSSYDTQGYHQPAYESSEIHSIRNNSVISSAGNKEYRGQSNFGLSTVMKDKLDFCSLSTKIAHQDEGSFPFLLTARFREDKAWSIGKKDTSVLAENFIASKGLSKDENKDRLIQKKLSTKQEFLSRKISESKWGVFLENRYNEDDSDDDDDDSDGVFTTIAESKLLYENQPDLL